MNTPAPRLPFWLSGFIFVMLWQVASGIGGSFVYAGWAILNRHQVVALFREARGLDALLDLITRNGDVMMLASAVAAFPTIGVVVLCQRFIDGQPLELLGVRFNARDFAVGAAAATITVLALLSLLVLLGNASISGLTEPWPLLRVVSLLPLVLLQSGTEELVCRGYLLRTSLRVLGPVSSTALVSLFFGALHLLNPDTSLLSFSSTVLIGVLFSIVTLKTNSLWAAVGLHTAWNFTLGTIASLPVSGLRLSHLFDVSVEGPLWVTGGGYGLEASVLMVAVPAVASVLLALRLRPRVT